MTHSPRSSLLAKPAACAALLPATLLLATLLLAALLLAALAVPLAAAEPSVPTTPPAPSGENRSAVAQRIVDQGIAIDFRLEAVTREAASRPLREGDAVRVSFTVSDTAGNTPLSGLYPAAWMDLLPKGDPGDGEQCSDKIETFLGGSLFSQPELDLNTFYVLALNDDPSITVVDPLFSFGNSKLLDLVELESPGEDWALTPDGRLLFVSMPEVSRVAVVDTATWNVKANVQAGPIPTRLALQAEGRFLWVANEIPDAPSGVTVVDTESLEVVARISTGKGPHDVVFAADERYAFISNFRAGTVSVVDTGTYEVLKHLETGTGPFHMAWSSLGRAVYVSHEDDGHVTILDDQRHEVVGRLEAAPGLSRIRFAPGGRYAFAVNPKNNRVYVLDAASQKIVQNGEVEPEPDQVVFSDGLAYIHHRGSELVYMIPLAGIGKEGAPLQVIDFPGGQRSVGKSSRPSLADTIVQAPGAPAVLVANPLDKMIYFYKEGMAAPMGSFRNYDRQPRAVQVVDRSLQERAPGRYETTVQLRRPGKYHLALYLDSPQVIHCFPLEVAADPALAAQETTSPVLVEYLDVPGNVPVDQEVTVRFRLTEPATGKLVKGVEDVRVLTYLVPGTWQLRLDARPATEGAADGVYEVRFTPPRKGIYYVFMGSASLGLKIQESQLLALEVGDFGPPPGEEPPPQEAANVP